MSNVDDAADEIGEPLLIPKAPLAKRDDPLIRANQVTEVAYLFAAEHASGLAEALDGSPDPTVGKGVVADRLGYLVEDREVLVAAHIDVTGCAGARVERHHIGMDLSGPSVALQRSLRLASMARPSE